MDEPIPVTVVTGFLGAGKSTLLDAWLADLPRDRTAVIINEQGQVGIDGALLAERALQIREITGGCICCQTQAALDAALTEFASATPRPTRILVETSGAASPAGVVRALTRGTARDALRLDGIITVVDAARADRVLKHDLAVEQLGFADVVALSHVDQLQEPDLGPLEKRLGAYAPGAIFVQAHHGKLAQSDAPSLEALLSQRGTVLRVPPTEGVARHGIDAVAMVHDGDLDEARFGTWVEEKLAPFEARILRLKGILAIEGVDERVILQGVGEAIEVTIGAPWKDAGRSSRLVVLGLGLSDDAERLRADFQACVADPPGNK